MKKLLTILSTLSLATTTATTIVACSHHKDRNVEAESSASLDAKVLNDIVNKTNKYFLDFLNSNQYVDTTQYGSEVFANFFNKVNKQEPTAVIDIADSNFNQGINNINTIFKNYLDQINIKIAQEYSNVYVNSYPLTWNLDKNISTLNFINLEDLDKLNPGVGIDGLQAVNYQLNINYTVKYKAITSLNKFTFSFIVTNNPDKIKQFQTESMAKLSGNIVKYFSGGDIIIDKNPKYQRLYDKFDINYSRAHISLDNIVQTELIDFLNKDPDLTDLMQHVTWNDDKSILTLLSGALNDVTSGKAVPSLPQNSSYVWAGEGPFDPNKVTAEVFYKFLINLLQVFNISDDELQLANFNVNLAKISVAGMPLSGAVSKDGKPLNVIIGISKEGLKQKLMNYSQIVVSFYKEYRIESYKDHQILHVSSKVFDELKSAPNYTESLPFLFNDFLEKENIKNLPDIGLFYLADATISNTVGWPGRWTTINENQLKYKDGGHGYSFSFMFGDHTFDNSISYSPWSNTYLPNLYINRN
ncbi:lipoprotein [Spiroplasma sp. DGKH1]|uniref:lipoprotein n=1 Tax=Spiroplasma sp. DGKH1 TaxID=3050074 RepID=UPI0034C66B39